MEGTVKWYNEAKSFGFIQVEDDKDVYVHQTGIEPGTTITEGDKVEFTVEQGDKGAFASGVKKL